MIYTKNGEEADEQEFDQHETDLMENRTLKCNGGIVPETAGGNSYNNRIRPAGVSTGGSLHFPQPEPQPLPEPRPIFTKVLSQYAAASITTPRTTTSWIVIAESSLTVFHFHSAWGVWLGQLPIRSITFPVFPGVAASRTASPIRSSG